MKTYTKAGKRVLFFNFALKGRSLHGKASFQIRAISHGRDHSSPRKIQSQVCVDTISVFEEGLQLSPDVYKNLNSRTNFGSQIRRYTTSVPSRKSREKRSTPSGTNSQLQEIKKIEQILSKPTIIFAINGCGLRTKTVRRASRIKFRN